MSFFDEVDQVGRIGPGDQVEHVWDVGGQPILIELLPVRLAWHGVAEQSNPGHPQMALKRGDPVRQFNRHVDHQDRRTVAAILGLVNQPIAGANELPLLLAHDFGAIGQHDDVG